MSRTILPETKTLAAPAGSEKLNVQLTEVKIEGGFEEMAAAHEALRAALVGSQITVAEIFEAAQRLEQDYAAAGYVLARVFVPKQSLDHRSSLRIVVLDGYIEEIRSDNLSPRVRDLVLARLQSLIRKPHLKIEEIEQPLLLAGDVPGLQMRSALTKGAAPGGTVLIVEGAQRLVSSAINGDNNLPIALGSRQATTSLAINSATGFGEQVYVSYGTSLQRVLSDLPLRVFGAGVSAPVGETGLTLNPEYTTSRSMPSSVTGAQSEGKFHRYALRWNYVFARDRRYANYLHGSLERNEQLLLDSQTSLNYNHDRYWVLRVGVDWMRITPWGSPVKLNALVSRGLAGRDLAEAAATAVPLSRDGASPLFTKFSGDLRYSQALPEEARIDLVARLQTNFGKPMMVSEQISLDGAEAVSNTASAVLSADAGVTLRGEVVRPFSYPLSFLQSNANLSPYLFLAGGAGHIAHATAVERTQLRAASFGGGLRLGVSADDNARNATLGVEFARILTNVAGHGEGYRATITGLLKY